MHECRKRRPHKDKRGVMSWLKLASLTCCMALIISCHRETIVTGSVFIVTKGKENIKLGLVQVTAIPEQAVLGHLQRLQDLKRARGDDGDAAKRLSREIELKKRMMDYLPFGATAETNRQLREELKQLLAEGFLENDARVLARAADLPISAKKLIFHDLPAAVAVAPTDADGKFTMRLPADTPVVLAAHSSREVGNTTEEYYWLCRFSALNSDKPILLSNQNLLSDDLIESVLAGQIPDT